MIENVTGDLFDGSFSFDAVGHGVNCQGVMGSGIAVPFRKAYPGMYARYKAICTLGYLQPGMVYPYLVNPRGHYDPRYVYNMASQFRPGPNAKMSYLRAAVQYVRFHAEEHLLDRVGLPRIGAGIGGLEWEDVYDTIKSVVEDSPVMFTMVSLEET